MTPHFLAHAFHILEGIDLIDDFLQNEQARLDEPLTYHATLRVLQTLSESTQKLPEDIKERHPQVMWRELSKMRNYLVHDYLGDLTPDQVWLIIRTYLPPLRKAMRDHVPNWPLPSSQKSLEPSRQQTPPKD